MSNRVLRNLSALAIVSVFSACAGSDAWEASEAALAGDPIAMWLDGQEGVRQGEDQVSRGEERIQEGRRIVREGESLVSEGTDMVTISRENYRLASQVAGSALTPEQLRSEAERLRGFARVWEEGLDSIERGNRRISDGNERIAEGQTIVLEGQTTIDSGQSLMRNSERIRREQEEAERERDAAALSEILSN